MTAEDERRKPDKPLKGTDYIFSEDSLPSWLPGPLRRTALDLTYREVHAAKLGLSGVVVGASWAAGLRNEAATLAMTLVGVAFGLKKLPDNKPVAGRVIRREPWFFTAVFILVTLLSVGFNEVLL